MAGEEFKRLAEAIERNTLAIEELAALERARVAAEAERSSKRRRPRPPRQPVKPSAEDRADAARVLRRAGVR